jgi:hypothetical protein
MKHAEKEESISFHTVSLLFLETELIFMIHESNHDAFTHPPTK